MKFLSWVFAALCAAVHARSLQRGVTSPTKHERLDVLPPHWTYQGRVQGETLITLRAYLKHGDQNFVRVAEAISNPSSANYRQHLSAEDLQKIFPDTSAASSHVAHWLKLNNIHDHKLSEDSIDFTTSVETANRLLQTTFSSYQHVEGISVIRTQNYSLPPSIAQVVDFIYPTVHFWSPKTPSRSALSKRQRVPSGPTNCTNAVCPDEIKMRYNISYRPLDKTSGSAIGIAGFLDTFPNITDVEAFIAEYGIEKNASFPQYNVLSINGGRTAITPDRGDLTVEPELDLDYSVAFTGPLDVTYYSTGGRASMLTQPGNTVSNNSMNEPYLEFLQSILAAEAPPQVISISYSDDEQSVPKAYAERVCNLMALVAARGISLIGSSGDGGASGSLGAYTCIGPAGERRFIPTFPSSCPWITSVGATAEYGGAAAFSSGGLSNYFSTPSWQAASVQQYLTELNGSHAGLYNASGRGIPDVSLVGDSYLTLTGGLPAPHYGTSASAPVFAAMIALINDIRLRAGKPVLGFLNPLLYAANATSAYRDVADNSTSSGCADGDFFESGWKALRGWDASTGLGEPDFEKLRAILA